MLEVASVTKSRGGLGEGAGSARRAARLESRALYAATRGATASARVCSCSARSFCSDRRVFRLDWRGLFGGRGGGGGRSRVLERDEVEAFKERRVADRDLAVADSDASNEERVAESSWGWVG